MEAKGKIPRVRGAIGSDREEVVMFSETFEFAAVLQKCFHYTRF